MFIFIAKKGAVLQQETEHTIEKFQSTKSTPPPKTLSVLFSNLSMLNMDTCSYLQS